MKQWCPLYVFLYSYTPLSSVHYDDVIMGAMASHITSLTIVYSIVYSDADQRKHQSSASLVFVRGIPWWPVYSSHKWPVTRKMTPFDDVIMVSRLIPNQYHSGNSLVRCQSNEVESSKISGHNFIHSSWYELCIPLWMMWTSHWNLAWNYWVFLYTMN